MSLFIKTFINLNFGLLVIRLRITLQAIIIDVNPIISVLCTLELLHGGYTARENFAPKQSGYATCRALRSVRLCGDDYRFMGIWL